MTLPRPDMEDSALFVKQLSVPEEVEPIIRGLGTSSDINKFLEAVDKLQKSIVFFDRNRHLNMCEGALRHARQLLNKAQQSLEADFDEMLGSSCGYVNAEDLREQLKAQMEAEKRTENFKFSEKNSEKNSENSGNLGNLEISENLNLNSFPELLDAVAVPDLKSMVDRLITMGRQSQVARFYRDRRGIALIRNLERLGVEKVTARDIQDMPWEDLDSQMKLWIENIRIVVEILLPGERSLCYEILEGMEGYRERCFAEFGGVAMFQAIMLGEAVSESKKSPEKLFALLDMYNAVKKLVPKVESMFDGPSSVEIRKSFVNLLKALASSARATFDEFEIAIEQNETEPVPEIEEKIKDTVTSQHRRKPSLLSRLIKALSVVEGSVEESTASARSPNTRTLPSDGGVHPLTSYVVNYVKFLTNSQLSYVSTLRAVFGESTQQQDGSYKSVKLTAAVSSIMLALTKNLQFKAKNLKDHCLHDIFLMNNINYISFHISTSDARELLGSNWMRRHWALVDQHQDGYIGAVCGKFEVTLVGDREDILSFLKRLKVFNQEFSELQTKVAAQTVWDPERRALIRKALQEKIGSPYGAFLKAHQDLLDSNRSLSKSQIFSIDDVEKILKEAFPTIVRSSSSQKS